MFAIILFIFCIANQSIISDAVRLGIDKCLYLLIPSLFPSMVLSSVISKSGIISKMAMYLPVDSDALEVFLIGNTGGYPTGAKTICDKISRKEIDSKSGQSMLKYAYNSGPAFCIGVVGVGLFGSVTIGLAIYLTQFAVNLLIFTICQVKTCKVKKPYRFTYINTRDISESVMSSFNASLTISAYVMLFAVINAVLSSVVYLDKHKCFTAVIDITALSDLHGVSFSVACLLVSFGGVCVISQISAFASGMITLHDFALSFLYKLPLCFIFSKFALLILDKSGVSVSTIRSTLSQSKSIVPLICISAMIVISALEYKKLPTK